MGKFKRQFGSHYFVERIHLQRAHREPSDDKRQVAGNVAPRSTQRNTKAMYSRNFSPKIPWNVFSAVAWFPVVLSLKV